MKYKGTYRLKPNLDQFTNDFPRTDNESIDFVGPHFTNGVILQSGSFDWVQHTLCNYKQQGCRRRVP